MKKWTVEQVIEARGNNEYLAECEPWLQEMFKECPDNVRLWWEKSAEKWNVDDEPTFANVRYRIPQNWPPADQIEDAKPEKPTKPTLPEFSTQYMLGFEQYHPEDDATELQRLIDGRDDLNDGIKVIRARLRRFDRFVAKKKWGKG